MQKVSTVLMTIALLAGVAMADTVFQPPWDISHPRATHAEWYFSTGDTSPAADVWTNPIAEPTANLYPGLGQSWLEDWGQRDGVWPLSGMGDFSIANMPEALERKEIYLQVVWAAEMDWENVVPIVGELLYDPEVTLVETIELGPTGADAPSGDTWYRSIYHMVIEPNPQEEIIRIAGSVFIDEVIVDTICIPEPTTISLLIGCAAIAAGRRRKRTC